MALPETASFARFAILAGVAKSYVTQLRRDGRLVLTADGKAVRVAESFARIKETEDPAKDGVRARHAAARASGEGQGASTTVPASPAAPADEEGAPEGGSEYQHWRMRNERAKATAAERENRVRDGELLEAGEVVTAIASATTTLRQRLEALADVLGPQLAAEGDEARCRALVAESVEHALEECARQFGALAKGDAT
jgi:hypothetical protein